MAQRLLDDAGTPGPVRKGVFCSQPAAEAPPRDRQYGCSHKGAAVLNVELVFNQSTITAAYATSPMKLLTPRSRGQTVVSYVSNFGGGLVAGDQTRLDLRIGEGARCFLGTQASTKIYRNPASLPCRHVTHAAVDEGAVLVFTPAPVQPFADSSYEQAQEFHLAAGAGLVLLDWFTSGRTACGERWAFRRYKTWNQVWQTQNAFRAGLNRRGSSETCIFLDSLTLDSAAGPLNAAYRTGRFNCFATLLLAGAPVQETAMELLKKAGSTPVQRRGSVLLGASPIRSGAVLRMAAEELAPLEAYLRQHFAPLAALLGDDPWARRW